MVLYHYKHKEHKKVWRQLTERLISKSYALAAPRGTAAPKQSLLYPGGLEHQLGVSSGKGNLFSWALCLALSLGRGGIGFVTCLCCHPCFSLRPNQPFLHPVSLPSTSPVGTFSGEENAQVCSRSRNHCRNLDKEYKDVPGWIIVSETSPGYEARSFWPWLREHS